MVRGKEAPSLGAMQFMLRVSLKRPLLSKKLKTRRNGEKEQQQQQNVILPCLLPPSWSTPGNWRREKRKEEFQELSQISWRFSSQEVLLRVSSLSHLQRDIAEPASTAFPYFFLFLGVKTGVIYLGLTPFIFSFPFPAPFPCSPREKVHIHWLRDPSYKTAFFGGPPLIVAARKLGRSLLHFFPWSLPGWKSRKFFHLGNFFSEYFYHKSCCFRDVRIADSWESNTSKKKLKRSSVQKD